MTKEDLEFFRDLLLKKKSDILNNGPLRKNDDLIIKQEDLADEADLASNIIDQNVSITIRDLELVKLRKIEFALFKIEKGEYGLCEECDEEISNQRLKLFPWAELCITHAEEKERNQKRAGFKY